MSKIKIPTFLLFIIASIIFWAFEIINSNGLNAANLSVPLILPNSTQYKKASMSWNARIKSKPAAIIFCKSNKDVQNALKWAKEHQKEIRIRSGRHSYEGFSTGENVVIIDISPMKTIELSQDKKSVKVAAGLNTYEVYERLWKEGLTLPLGSCPTVGVTGLALGGGIGFSARKMGLSCDNILEIEMIDAEGNLLTINKANYPDLFWACRGAGNGNFGVITSITFKTHPVSKVMVYTIEWDWKHLYQISRAWFTLLKSSPHELMTFLRFTKIKSKKTLRSFGQFFGSREDLEKLLKPLLKISPQTVDIREVPYMEAANKWGGVNPNQAKSQAPKPQSFKATSLYLEEPLTNEAIKVIDEFYSQPSAINNFTVLDSYGGVISEVSDDENAFAHRRSIASMQTLAYWDAEENEASQLKWSRDFYQSIKDYGKGAYVNYPDLDLPDWGKAYYGDHLERLIEIKTKYDPHNVFHYSQSIPLRLTS